MCICHKLRDKSRASKIFCLFTDAFYPKSASQFLNCWAISHSTQIQINVTWICPANIYTIPSDKPSRKWYCCTSSSHQIQCNQRGHNATFYIALPVWMKASHYINIIHLLYKKSWSVGYTPWHLHCFMCWSSTISFPGNGWHLNLVLGVRGKAPHNITGGFSIMNCVGKVCSIWIIISLKSKQTK